MDKIMKYMGAVDFLIGNIEFMMEDGEYNEGKLIKRIEVVEKFKDELLESITGE